jgi:hypothetical protein
MDGVHHAFEHRIKQLSDILRILVGKQLHGALDISDEDRDLFALALQGGLRVDDFLGQMFR